MHAIFFLNIFEPAAPDVESEAMLWLLLLAFIMLFRVFVRPQT